MATKIKLGDLQQAADNKYGAFVVEDVPGGDVVLLNGLRLSEEKKIELDKLQVEASALAQKLESGALSDEERERATKHPMFGRILRLVCENDEAAVRLFNVIGDDHGLMLTIWNAYTEAAQPGEATPSQS